MTEERGEERGERREEYKGGEKKETRREESEKRRAEGRRTCSYVKREYNHDIVYNTSYTIIVYNTLYTLLYIIHCIQCIIYNVMTL